MFSVLFLAQILRLVSAQVRKYVRDVSTEESIVLEDHDIFVGKILYKKNGSI